MAPPEWLTTGWLGGAPVRQDLYPPPRLHLIAQHNMSEKIIPINCNIKEKRLRCTSARKKESAVFRVSCLGDLFLMKYRLPTILPDAKLNMSPHQYRFYFGIMVYSHPSIYSKEMFVKLNSLCLLFICTKFLLSICLKIVMDCITVQKSSFSICTRLYLFFPLKFYWHIT